MDQRLLSFSLKDQEKSTITSAIIKNSHHGLKISYLFSRLHIVTSVSILHLTWFPDPVLFLPFKIQCPEFVLMSFPLQNYKLLDVVFVSFSKFGNRHPCWVNKLLLNVLTHDKDLTGQTRTLILSSGSSGTKVRKSTKLYPSTHPKMLKTGQQDHKAFMQNSDMSEVSRST